MGAIFRFITRRANGRESARIVEVEGDSFTIGRGTDCALQLPDLRIALLHARVEVIRPGVAAVEAEGANTFQSGGRRTRRVELNLANKRAIEIGPYQLSFLEDEGRVRVDVERAEAPLKKLSDEETERVFSLKGAGLGKRVPAWALIAATVAAFLVFPLLAFHQKAAPIGAQSIATRDINTPSSNPELSQPTKAAVTAGLMWTPGHLSDAHSFLGRDCKSCHTKSLAAVDDRTCLNCHKDLQQHADPHLMLTAMPEANPAAKLSHAIAARFDRPPGRCASCHMEHMGQAGIMISKETLCSNCHGNLNQRLNGKANIGNAADFADLHPQFSPTVISEPKPVNALLTRQWSVPELDAARRMRENLIRYDPTRCDGFSIGKPNFRGLVHLTDRNDVPRSALAGDNPGLVFPHALHMSSKGCVASMAKELGVKTDSHGALGCANCHTSDPTGKTFVPVEMTRNCSVCHSLTFDNFNGVNRTLPHGQPQLVVATMLDFYKGAAVDVVKNNGAGERHLPGQAAMDRSSLLRMTAFTQADSRAADRVRAIFSPGGTCYGCHEIQKPTSGLNYGVAPVVLQEHFFPRAMFDHKAHAVAGMSCEQCHAARKSQSAADVLMPSIETCRTCHAGAHAEQVGAINSPCVQCHSFHAVDATAPLMKPRSLVATGQAPGKSAALAPPSGAAKARLAPPPRPAKVGVADARHGGGQGHKKPIKLASLGALVAIAAARPRRKPSITAEGLQ